MQGSYRLEYAVVRSVHGRLKLGKHHQQTSRDKTQRHLADNEQRSRETQQQCHLHQPPTQQHHQRGARLSRRQSDQNVKGVDLLEHLVVNDEKADENDYEKPFF